MQIFHYFNFVISFWLNISALKELSLLKSIYMCHETANLFWFSPNAYNNYVISPFFFPLALSNSWSLCPSLLFLLLCVNKDNANRHVNVDRGKLKRSQLQTTEWTIDKQGMLRVWECLLQGRPCQLLIQYQMVSPEDIQTEIFTVMFAPISWRMKSLSPCNV